MLVLIGMPLLSSANTDLEKSQIEDYIFRTAFERGINPQKAVYIAQCESGFDPNVTPGDHGTSYGLWQIHMTAHTSVTMDQATDVEWSTDWAFDRMQKEDYSPWVICSKRYAQSRVIHLLAVGD